MKIKSSNKLKTRWLYIIIFYIIAVLISSLFNSGLLTPFYEKLVSPSFLINFSYLPASFGTLIAALFAFLFNKNRNKNITFLGNNILKNIIIGITPFIIFSIIGMNNEFKININQFALVFGAINLVYANFEEIFWRGFLQNELNQISVFFRYLLIGTMWWAWHMRFSTTFDLTVFLLICIGSSFLMGAFVEKTKSYFTTAGFHLVIILLSNTGNLDSKKITAGLLTFFVWTLISIFWKK